MMRATPRPAYRNVAAYAGQRSMTMDDLQRNIEALAQRLPPSSCLINLCQDRIHFATALLAAEVACKITLLPSSVQPAILRDLLREWPDSCIVTDRPQSVPQVLPIFDVNDGNWHRPSHPTAAPSTAAHRTGFYVYTSGSTGTPQRHFKTYEQVRQSAQQALLRLVATFGARGPIVGTSPFQHMYGLESTVFLPLQGFGPLTARQPLFPADVAAALHELAEPALLVTTPYHLSKILQADLAFPPLLGLLSATAPMPTELARQAEERFGIPVLEIYGSTETGQLATRRPTLNASWELFEGVSLQPHGETIIATGGHLDISQPLNDRIELEGPRHFRLLGRHADMVCVAGKRSSLAYLTHCLTRIPGVEDGIVCLSSGTDHAVRRVMAFAVSRTLRRGDILDALRQVLDPVFLPRPLMLIDQLPRDANGKIVAATLERLRATAP